MVKVVGLLRFFSIILFLGILALVYAYLPLQVQLLPDDTSLRIPRDTFFYGVASLFLVVNVAFGVIARLLQKPLQGKNDQLFAWIKAGSPAINVYITLLIGFVGVVNNSLSISPSNYAYLNFLGPVVLVAWIVGCLYLAMKAKPVASEG